MNRAGLLGSFRLNSPASDHGERAVPKKIGLDLTEGNLVRFVG
jgi:hypothetical protein